MKILIVGSGLSGSVCARLLAEQGHQIRVIDERSHWGGNCHDSWKSSPTLGGNLVHNYGPHLFHTSNEAVWAFLSKFAFWTPYRHRVMAEYSGQFFELPININTIEQFFGIESGSLNPDSAKALMADITKPYANLEIQSTDDVFLKSMGWELTNVFFRPYTEKMWGKSATQIEASVGARLPIRYSRESGYFLDKYQALPNGGYTQLLGSILNHPKIDLELNRSFTHNLASNYDLLITSQPIDQFFDYELGDLSYRSLEFICGASTVQPTAQLNYTDRGPFTRQTVWSHLPNHGSGKWATVERPVDWRENGKRFYPVRNKETISLYAKYEAKTKELHNVLFIGRLGKFLYQDMDAVIASSLQLIKGLGHLN